MFLEQHFIGYECILAGGVKRKAPPQGHASAALRCISLNSSLGTGLAGLHVWALIRGILSEIGIYQ
jgi:hypothetical protein